MNTTREHPRPPLPELRIRTVGEVLDASIKIWGSNIRKLAVITGVITAGFQFLGAGAVTLMKPTILDEIQRVQELKAKGSTASLHITPGMALGTLVDFALNSVSTVLVIAAMTVVVGTLYRAGGTSPVLVSDARSVVVAAMRRSPANLAVHAVAAVTAVLVGLAITVPLGVIGEATGLGALSFSAGLIGAFGVWITYLSLHAGLPAVMEEGLGALATLKRSVKLSRRHRRSITGAAFVLAIVTGIPSALITGMLRSILSSLGGNNTAFEFVWVGAARTVAVSLSLPVAAIGVVLVYVNLRLHAGEPALESAATGN